MIARRALFLGLVLCLVSPLFAADPIKLHAGKLTMVFEPDTALLRNLRVGEHLVLLGISAPVRDRFWGTVPPAVSNIRLQQQEDSFTLDFDVTCRQREIDFFWQGKITGTASGQVIFAFDGVARSEFLRNRIGFCVLHSAEAAGKPCVVQTVDGKSLEGRFPTFIAPHQPFKDIRAIKHQVSGDVWATVRMEGDTFEMEDQRNWTDASFKTYCTPLALAFPVKVDKGTKVSQRIELSLAGAENIAAAKQDERLKKVVISVDPNKRNPLPGIGLRVSSQVTKLSDREIELLGQLQLDHLRVDLNPSDADTSEKLRRAAQQAQQLDVQLIVGLHVVGDKLADLDNLNLGLRDILPPSTWLLNAADDDKVQFTRHFLKLAGQPGKIGRGEDTNFTELNRGRPDPKTIDVVSYGMNPQIHAFDNTSMIETLAIQGDTVRTARQFVGDLPILISPITLRKQAVDQAPAAGELPASVDPRQSSLFAAGWTIGSIKYLAEAGANRLTYFETVGWLGVVEAEAGNPLPSKFPSKPGRPFPIFNALREVGKFAGGSVCQTTSTDPLSVIALALENGDERKMLLSNLTTVEQEVSIQNFGTPIQILRWGLDRDTVDMMRLNASKDGNWQLSLPPHSIALIRDH